jgi:nitrate reductase NapE component
MPEPLETLSNDAFFSLKHPLQPRRFVLALFFALILFPLIAIALVAGTIFIVVPMIGLLLWMSGRILFAFYLGNSILVSELNYPRIHRIGEDLKARIEYKKPVNIFVYEHGNFNAYLMKFLFYRRAVFLNSELLEVGVTDDELRWLIGRFVGYLRARRQAGFWGWSIRAAQQMLVFNLFLLPYERALVYTGDRIALAMINGDICSAASAMQKLFVGRQLGYTLNPNGLLDQHRSVKGSLFAFLARVGMAYPHLTARYVDLIEFTKERYPEQFQRFDAENPGLPADLRPLTALPEALVSTHGKRDPVWGSLTAAVLVFAIGGFGSFELYRVVVPHLAQRGSSEQGSALPPAAIETSTTAPAVEPVSEARPAASEAQPATSEAQPAVVETQLPASEAQPFISAAGRFSVMFPGAPTHNSKPLALSDTDTVTLHHFQFTGNGIIYLVTYNDFPTKYVAADPQAVLGSVRDGSVESSKGRLIHDGAMDLNGVPGRAYSYTGSDGNTYLVHELLNGQRLYQIFVIVGAGTSPAEVEDFLNSFRIL